MTERETAIAEINILNSLIKSLSNLCNEFDLNNFDEFYLFNIHDEHIRNLKKKRDRLKDRIAHLNGTISLNESTQKSSYLSSDINLAFKVAKEDFPLLILN